jgi:predicted N-formylglutamate amidohydrolase
MNHARHSTSDDLVIVENAQGQSRVVIVCEHASCYMPDIYDNLGLEADALQSHAAWDPGALSVAQGMSAKLDATLVASGVSRLIYDCNRSPTSVDAMPTQSEAIKVPGNVGLTTEKRLDRVNRYYKPFRIQLSKRIAATPNAIIVTVHSFTPLYHGAARAVEIGILHDTDTRLADIMLQLAPSHTDANVQRNAPYGPEHGVTHTLKEHAIKAGLLNVMIEIRNDLVQTAEQQDAMANVVANWLLESLKQLQSTKVAQ